MSFSTVIIYEAIFLLISVIVILSLLLKGWKKEEERGKWCEDCYYYGSRNSDDFSPCWMCEKGNQYKDNGQE